MVRRSPLKRRAPLRSRKRKLPRVPSRNVDEARTLRRDFKAAAVAMGCVMCADHPDVDAPGVDLLVIDAHHVIAKRHLRQAVAGLPGLEAQRVVWDARDALGLCRFHHSRHEAWVERVPRRLLPAGAFEFAAEHGLGWLFDREYPIDEEAV